MNWQDTGPHAPSVRPGRALGQGCQQSCWPARPQVSQGLVPMPVDSPQIFASGSALSHRHLPQTQHTTNKSLNCHSTGALSVTQHPELIRTKTQSHLQLCPSLGYQGQFLSGAFCLPALYFQLCRLPATLPPQPPGPCSSLLTDSLLPFLPHDLKKCKPDPTTFLVLLSQDKVWADSMGRPAPARLPDQLQGPLPQSVSLGWPHGATKLSHLQPFNKWPLGLDHALPPPRLYTAPNLRSRSVLTLRPQCGQAPRLDERGLPDRR